MAPVLVAGLDSRGLFLEAPLLYREGCVVEERPSGLEALRALLTGDARLVVLGTRLNDVSLAEVVRRIRASPELRTVSILALIPAHEPPLVDREVGEAGANAVVAGTAVFRAKDMVAEVGELRSGLERGWAARGRTAGD
jgi:CheY-like chemotaxis protein